MITNSLKIRRNNLVLVQGRALFINSLYRYGAGGRGVPLICKSTMFRDGCQDFSQKIFSFFRAIFLDCRPGRQAKTF
jgi:hypothetical protein